MESKISPSISVEKIEYFIEWKLKSETCSGKKFYLCSTTGVVRKKVMTTMRKLPIGIQSFENIRNENYLYVDKTALIYQLVTKGKPYFLSRPHRFGKSLLISTLEALWFSELYNSFLFIYIWWGKRRTLKNWRLNARGKIRSVFYVKPHSYVSEFEYICVDFKCK